MTKGHSSRTTTLPKRTNFCAATNGSREHLAHPYGYVTPITRELSHFHDSGVMRSDNLQAWRIFNLWSPHLFADVSWRDMSLWESVWAATADERLPTPGVTTTFIKRRFAGSLARRFSNVGRRAPKETTWDNWMEWHVILVPHCRIMIMLCDNYLYVYLILLSICVCVFAVVHSVYHVLRLQPTCWKGPSAAS